ncbi:MAG: hypothetical protein EPN21_08535 [Methylococcaceae bacterium]|nr:MAG: hypothetical protein EPN21_08535 [Methylococcaceae bacterium]
MQQKFFVIAALVFLLAGATDNLLAAPPHKPTGRAKPKPTAATHRAMPCQVSVSGKEDREIVIMKLTQRLDCLENKVNYLSEQLALQTKGAVKPFVEQPKEFVIRYPRETPEP